MMLILSRLICLLSLKELALIESYLEEAPFEELSSDDVMVNDTPSSKHIHLACTESLNVTPISFPSLSTTPSHFHIFNESLGDIRGSLWSHKLMM